jgi:transposase-like protein
MSKSRRKYSAEFKHEAVRLTQETQRTVAEVAANLGINPGVLQRWKAQMKANGAEAFPGHGRLNRGRSKCIGRGREVQREESATRPASRGGSASPSFRRSS